MEIAAIAVLVITALFILFRYRQRHRQGEESLSNTVVDTESTGLKSSLPLPLSTIPIGTTTVAVSQVYKSFNDTHAVNDVSFEVKSGEIMGMVGPNGAGKTTAIRMLMNIIEPDSGQISILGNTAGEDTRDRVGYLPEERGLYRKISVAKSLEYMAQLKGLNPDESRLVRDQWLERLGMSIHKGKKTEQLSKGMGQIIQLAATVIHDPELVVLDEPFSGLDPVNRDMLKKIILELKKCGRTIILSTHQMNEVEELCDRVLMINKGRIVLYGDLHEVRSRYRNDSIFLECTGSIDDLHGVSKVKDHGTYHELFLDQGTSANQILGQLIERKVTIDRFEVSTPSLHEVFIKVAQDES